MLGEQHYEVVLAACFWEEAASVVDYIKYEDTLDEQDLVNWAPLYDAIQTAELSGEGPCREPRSESLRVTMVSTGTIVAPSLLTNDGYDLVVVGRFSQLRTVYRRCRWDHTSTTAVESRNRNPAYAQNTPFTFA